MKALSILVVALFVSAAFADDYDYYSSGKKKDDNYDYYSSAKKKDDNYDDGSYDYGAKKKDDNLDCQVTCFIEQPSVAAGKKSNNDYGDDYGYDSYDGKSKNQQSALSLVLPDTAECCETCTQLVAAKNQKKDDGYGNDYYSSYDNGYDNKGKKKVVAVPQVVSEVCFEASLAFEGAKKMAKKENGKKKIFENNKKSFENKKKSSNKGNNKKSSYSSGSTYSSSSPTYSSSY